MGKRIAYLGMDIHKNSITMVLFVGQHKDIGTVEWRLNPSLFWVIGPKTQNSEE